MKRITIFVCLSLLILSCNQILVDSNQDSNNDIFHKPIIADKSDPNSRFSSAVDYELNDEAFGNQEVFWVFNCETWERYQINATLLAVGTRCYIYVDNDTIEQDGITQWIDYCEFYRDEFDSTIYPKAVEFAGYPDGTLGDVDGDPHITILFSPLIGATGYYAAVHDKTIHYYSNKREMITIDTRIDLNEVMITLPHEFNHLIWGNNEEEEAMFLVEGGAEYATYYTGYLMNDSYLIAGQDYNLTDFEYYFRIHPEVSLLCFDRDNDDTRIHYANSYMFYFYFAEKYGLAAAQELIHTEEDGIQAIELVLSNHGYDASFNDVYLDWITACTLDLEGVYDNLYSLDNANFRISTVTEVLDTRFSETESLYEYYGFNVKKLLTPSDEFTLQISSPRDQYGLGIVVAIYDKTGWNITQNLVYEENDLISYYCSGDEIEYAYVLTSLMKESPNAPIVSYPAPTDNLNFTITEGHILPTTPTEETLFNLSFSALIFSLIITMKIYQRKKEKVYNL